MSDIIKLLPEHVANQIAAGEVIQRPASVVKELLDNAIDAQSTSIKLIVREGGKTLIHLIDNGAGMSATDARMCWERHATSKISKAEDIFQVKTMGFRGEALASIASVAMVELRTKRPQDKSGTCIIIEGTEVKSQEPVGVAEGTSILVKNLFYNIPARRNFLKSDAVEMRHIIDEFTRVALANPMIEMSLYNNENDVYKLSAATHAQRITDMFKHKLNEHFIELNEQTSIVKLRAFIGKPEFAKRTRGEQFIFVNNRFIKDAYLNHAVYSCYENLISKEQFPFYILFLEIDPTAIDINVHPTKTEIKFEDERSVYQIVKAVVKRALGEQYHIPIYEPSSNEQFIQTQAPISSNLNDDIVNSRFSNNDFNKPSNRNDWQELFEVLNRKKDTISGHHFIQSESNASKPKLIQQQEDANRNITQIHCSLIISQIKTGIMLIDQQAAHERILFEKYLNAFRQHPMATQQKLFPKTITLNTHDEALLKEMMPQMQILGFDINELGKNTFSINGMPAELHAQNEQELIEDLLDSYKKQTYNTTERNEKISRTLARKAAVKSGTILSIDEMTNLIDELFACSTPYLSPDGKPCLVRITLEELFGLLKK